MAVHKLIIAGFGGQGILLIGQILAYAGMLEGKEVTFLPSYGPEMRGGTANCTVILSDEPISCPIVDRSTVLVAMNQPSLNKFENIVAPSGHIFVNSSLIKQKVARTDVSVYELDATSIASSLGQERTANIVMLGFLNDKLGIVKRESLEASLANVFSESKAHLLSINKKAMDAWK